MKLKNIQKVIDRRHPVAITCTAKAKKLMKPFKKFVLIAGLVGCLTDGLPVMPVPIACGQNVVQSTDGLK